MGFRERLQVRPGGTRIAPDPMDPGFNKEVFWSAYQSYSDHSKEDYFITSLGLLVGFRVERLFATLKDLEQRARTCSFDEVARAVTLLMHRRQTEIVLEEIAALEGVSQITHEGLRSQRIVDNGLGNKLALSEVMERYIDSARHLLRRTRDEKGFGGRGAIAEVHDLDIIIDVALRLGSQLESLRSLWHNALWYRADVQVQQAPPYNYSIDLLNSRLAFMVTVDLERQKGTYERDLKEVKPLIRRKIVLRKVLFINDDRAGISLSVKRVADLPDEIKVAAISLGEKHEVMISSYLRFFLKESHPSLKEETFETVLDVWYLLAILAAQDSMRALGMAHDRKNDDGSFLTMISSDKLISAASKCLGVEENRIKTVIEFLTFKGKHQQLWSRPLLKVSNGIMLLWFPLQGAHLMRLLHEWGTSNDELKTKYQEKGHRYEELVFAVMDGLNKFVNPVISFLPLGPRLEINGQYSDGRNVGDVDGAFVVDSTLFILECRAVRHPAEPYEFWSVENDLEDKLPQIEDKKEYIEANPSVVLSWLKTLGIKEDLVINRIIPLVITNSYLREGEQAEAPYFVHLDTLFNALLTGASDFGGLTENNQELTYRVSQARCGLSGADALIEALRNPPKAEAFKSMVVHESFPLPPFDHTDAPGVIRQPVLHLPRLPKEAEAILRRCSFGDDIETISG
jgi:hypothetical protein